MSMTETTQHWSDQFTRPTVAELRSELPAETAALFDLLHKAVSGLDGITIEMAWYGEPWRWTVSYHTSLSEEPVALVIPNPEDLQMSMPLDRSIADNLASQRLKRTILDGLEMALSPFDTRWCVWSISGASMVEDLQDIASQKLVMLAKAAS